MTKQQVGNGYQHLPTAPHVESAVTDEKRLGGQATEIEANRHHSLPLAAQRNNNRQPGLWVLSSSPSNTILSAKTSTGDTLRTGRLRALRTCLSSTVSSLMGVTCLDGALLSREER
ncbi:hypothetical protein BaRGS_00011198 [Batillaria attramentaria]|uniref:Uncharacterized protein n=1 Tax=Batillaria attramentaria TaxID=370345 RepID=A0ABD0LDR5_9CAEN